VEGDTYGITQEALSELLGVRRATVGEICGTLQRAGLIHYQRGMITIADRPAIEQRTCECFHKASRVYRKLYRADDVGLSALVP
jgi:Mn-dependent DtxR family transcriptional regulator